MFIDYITDNTFALKMSYFNSYYIKQKMGICKIPTNFLCFSKVFNNILYKLTDTDLWSAKFRPLLLNEIHTFM